MSVEISVSWCHLGFPLSSQNNRKFPVLMRPLFWVIFNVFFNVSNEKKIEKSACVFWSLVQQLCIGLKKAIQLECWLNRWCTFIRIAHWNSFELRGILEQQLQNQVNRLLNSNKAKCERHVFVCWKLDLVEAGAYWITNQQKVYSSRAVCHSSFSV